MTFFISTPQNAMDGVSGNELVLILKRTFWWMLMRHKEVPPKSKTSVIDFARNKK